MADLDDDLLARIPHGRETTRRCAKHGLFTFHPDVLGVEEIECPTCQIAAAKGAVGGRCAEHGRYEGKACSYCTAAATLAAGRRVLVGAGG